MKACRGKASGIVFPAGEGRSGGMEINREGMREGDLYREIGVIFISPAYYVTESGRRGGKSMGLSS